MGGDFVCPQAVCFRMERGLMESGLLLGWCHYGLRLETNGKRRLLPLL